MPNPHSDLDQLRFASIRNRMLDGAAKTLPDLYLRNSGASNRDELREKITKSDSIMAIIDCCAFEALRIEEEQTRAGSPGRRPGMEKEGRKHAKR